MKKVLVTGGAGFIGSHLVETLVKRGDDVIVVDDLSTGSRQNLKEVIDYCSFNQKDILDGPALSRLMKGVDYVFHMAAVVSIARSIEDPLDCNLVNTQGTLNVLEAAKLNRVKKVVFSSSAAVYGNNNGPESPYALSKLSGEYYCQLYAKLYNLSTVSLRYFNVYGPKQKSGVIPIFIKTLNEGKAPIIYSGDQTRDFIFVQDIVRANLLAAESQANGSLDIGSGDSISINQLFKLIAELIGCNISPIYQTIKLGEVHESQANISRAKSLGFTPGWTIEKGLTELINS